MNIYDVLRKLIEARPWQDYERAEALDIIKECEHLGVFGTTARNVTEQHEHDWYPVPYTRRKRCRVCTVEQEMDLIEQRQGMR